MDEIPKAVWQIHAKLNEKEMKLKAKERALQACEDALIAREKAITIRENAIDEKVLKFGLHEYDPKLSSAKNGGENIDQRSKRSDHLLPSFAANTQCPKDSSDTELEVEASAVCENQEAKENDCAPESNIRSLNEVLPEKHISITDPESMSSQLLHLFDNSNKVGAQKNSCGISLVRKHGNMRNHENQITIPVHATSDEDSLERTVGQSKSKQKACSEKAFLLPQVKDHRAAKSKNYVQNEKRRSRGKDISRGHLRSNKQKFSGLYSVGRPSLSNFM